MRKREHYKVEDGKLKRDRPFCPRCGQGVFLAQHDDRISCGRCGYTEFRKKGTPEKKSSESPT